MSLPVDHTASPDDETDDAHDSGTPGPASLSTAQPADGVADRFDAVGQQVAAVLRAAHEEARSLRAAAEIDAEQTRAQSRREADELRADAEADRDEAKRLLLAARDRADQLVLHAEQGVASAVRQAEHEARTRVTTVLDAGRQRLDRLVDEEQRARERLLEAQGELAAVIERLSDPLPLIDLTDPEPTVRFGLVAVPTPESAPTSGGPGGERTVVRTVGSAPSPSQPSPYRRGIGNRRDDGQRRRRSDRDDGAAAAVAEDPAPLGDAFTTMVRGAVDRAVETAADGDGHDRPPRRSTPTRDDRRTDPSGSDR